MENELTDVIEADSATEAISQFKNELDENGYHYTGLVIRDSTDRSGSTEYLVAAINDYDLSGHIRIEGVQRSAESQSLAPTS